MAVQGTSLAVYTTPTILTAIADPSDPIKYNQGGQAVLIQNLGTNTVYLGGADVNMSSYGHALAPNASVSVDLDAGEHVYAIVASSSGAVSVLRAGV